jgi:hypothetical protein
MKEVRDFARFCTLFFVVTSLHVSLLHGAASSQPQMPTTLVGMLRWIGENKQPSTDLENTRDLSIFAQEIVRRDNEPMRRFTFSLDTSDVVRLIGQRMQFQEGVGIESNEQLKVLVHSIGEAPVLCSDLWTYNGENIVPSDSPELIQLRQIVQGYNIFQPDLLLTAEAMYSTQNPDEETRKSVMRNAAAWARSMAPAVYTNKNRRIQLARSGSFNECVQAIKRLLYDDIPEINRELKGKQKKEQEKKRADALHAKEQRAVRLYKEYQRFINNGLWQVIQEQVRSIDRLNHDDIVKMGVDVDGEQFPYLYYFTETFRYFVNQPQPLEDDEKYSVAAGLIPQILSNLLNPASAGLQDDFLRELDVRARIVLGFALGDRFWDAQWNNFISGCWNASRLELNNVLKKIQRAIVAKSDGQYQNLVNLIQRFITYLYTPASEVPAGRLHVVAKNIIQSLNQGANAECGVYALHNGLLFARNARSQDFNDRSLYQPINRILVERARVEADRVMHGLHEAVRGGAVTEYLRNFERLTSEKNFPQSWLEASQNFIAAVRAWIAFDYEAFVQGAESLIEQQNSLTSFAYGTEFEEDEEPYNAATYAQALQNLCTVPRQIQQQLEAATGNMLNPEIIEEIRRRSGAAGEAVVICPITPRAVVDSLEHLEVGFLVEGDLDERMYRKIAEFQNAGRGARIELVVTNGGHWIVVDCIKLDRQRIVVRVADSVGGYTLLADEALKMITNQGFQRLHH